MRPGHDWCHVLQVKMDTPSTAAVVLASPDGADGHDYSTPMVEGPAVRPAGSYWTDPASYTPPSCTLWEMMCEDSPFASVPTPLSASAISAAATAPAALAVANTIRLAAAVAQADDQPLHVRGMLTASCLVSQPDPRLHVLHMASAQVLLLLVVVTNRASICQL